VERAVLLTDGEELDIERAMEGVVLAAPSDLRVLERRHIEETLRRHHGVVEGPAGAARALGIPASTLRSALKRHGLRAR